MRTTKDHRGQSSDPTLYRSPTEAVAAPREELAYVVGFDPTGHRADALFHPWYRPPSSAYGRVIRDEKRLFLDSLSRSAGRWPGNCCNSVGANRGEIAVGSTIVIADGSYRNIGLVVPLNTKADSRNSRNRYVSLVCVSSFT